MVAPADNGQLALQLRQLNRAKQFPLEDDDVFSPNRAAPRRRRRRRREGLREEIVGSSTNFRELVNQRIIRERILQTGERSPARNRGFRGALSAGFGIISVGDIVAREIQRTGRIDIGRGSEGFGGSLIATARGSRAPGINHVGAFLRPAHRSGETLKSKSENIRNSRRYQRG